MDKGLREFLDEVDAKLRREQGWLRWAWNKVRARVTVRWPLRWYLFWHGHPPVSQAAFDAVSADFRRCCGPDEACNECPKDIAHKDSGS